MSAVVSSNQPRDMRFIQLGFPAVFSEYYAESGRPTAYFGAAIHGVPMEADGDSVQDQYQVQKRLDAKRGVLNRIANNAAIQSNLSQNGGLPQYVKPELSQRRFANPSMGAFADIYSARPQMVGAGGSESNFDSHLSGGVLRTAQGQRWIKNVLQERANQLNVIDSDVAKFTSYKAPEFAETQQEKAISQGLSEAAGIKLHLELSALLSGFATAIQAGDYSRFALNDLFKFLQILFRVGATSTADELNDLLSVIDELMGDVRGVLSGEQGPDGHEIVGKDYLFLGTIQTIMTQAREYLKRMIGAVTKSPKDRKAASRNAVKNLKFTNALTKGNRDDRFGHAEEMVKRIDVLNKLQRERQARDDSEAREADRFVHVVRRKRRTNAQIVADRVAGIPSSSEFTARIRAGVPAARNAASVGMVQNRMQNRIQEGAQTLIANANRRNEGRRYAQSLRSSIDGQGHAVKEVAPAVKLDRDFRGVWGARQGAYYGEELPAPLGYVNPAVHQNRKPISNSLKPRNQSGAPTFSG